MMTLGEKIYKQRKKLGYSQEELAFQVGVTRQAISKWETNSMQPTLDNVKQLSSVLGVNINYFISKQDENEILIDEVAVSGEKEVENIIQKKTYIGLIIGIVLMSIISAVMIFLSVVLGKAVFTSNIGDYNTITSSGIDKEFFFVVLAVTIVFLLSDLALTMCFVLKKYKCKAKLTKCKE